MTRLTWVKLADELLFLSDLIKSEDLDSASDELFSEAPLPFSSILFGFARVGDRPNVGDREIDLERS